MLSYAAEGISKLLENGGRMRLIFGGEISEDDLNAMTTGYEMRSSIQKLGLEFVSTIEQTADRLAHYRLTALSWMVANGWLDIKLALKRRGMYHEKIGILRMQMVIRWYFRAQQMRPHMHYFQILILNR